ncbi:MAG: DNA adenine methylase [Candidatus Thermoplasmatota archaeon]|jgi:DNA adenine methylase|nr:DNA adenine methylase [Candidatus Thermoplasmatota archaeon]
MKPTVTPLRYPGGKTWILPYIKEFLRFHHMNLGTIVEPFAGSASVSIGLLKDNLADLAYICENDPLIFAFWESVLYRNNEFIESVRHLQITMDTWYDFKKYLEHDVKAKYDSIELGLAFLFYNRTNYSGIIKAGPIGGKRQLSKYTMQCRFNIDRIIKKIHELAELSDKVKIFFSDGIDFIRKFDRSVYESDVFFYIDPPYYNAGKVLYRNYFNDDDHSKLASILTEMETPWLVSYDESDFIYGLYTTSKSHYVYTDYQAGNLKRGMRELLFSNRKIPPIATEVKIDAGITRNRHFELI